MSPRREDVLREARNAAIGNMAFYREMMGLPQGARAMSDYLYKAEREIETLRAQLAEKDAALQAAKSELIECIEARDRALEHAKRLQALYGKAV